MKKTQKIIQDFSGGWASDYAKDGTGTNNALSGQYTQGTNINPYRGGYLGNLSSRPNATIISTGSTGSTSIPFSAFYDTRTAWADDKLLVDVNGVVRNLDANSGVSSNAIASVASTGVGHAILFVDQASSNFAQTVFHYDGTSFRTLDSANVVTNNATPSGFALTGTIAGAKSAQMIVGTQNKLYFTNGNYVGTYNPNTPSFTPQAFLLTSGYLAQSICSYGNYVAIVANNYTSAAPLSVTASKLYIWDGSSSTAVSIHDIQDTYVHYVYEEDGTLLILTSGLGGTFKIKRFTGNSVLDTPEFEIGSGLIEPFSAVLATGGLYEGGVLNHNRLDYTRGQLFMQGFDGKVYSYGSPYKNRFRSGFHCIFDPQLASPFSSGSILRYPAGFVKASPRRNELFIGYRDSTGNPQVACLTLDEINSQSMSSSVEQSTWVSELINLPARSNVERIVVQFSDFTNSRATFRSEFYKEHDSQNYYLDEAQGVPINTMYYPINLTVSDVNAFYLKFNFTSCSIKSITIVYSYDNLDA
jgi:hypothetical protein